MSVKSHIENQSASDYSIIAQGISKQYQIGLKEERHDSFRELLASVFTSPFKKYKTLSGKNKKATSFFALKGVDLKIERGDIVGVIGHNGAGKSTLLKVLSRITSPTEGEIRIQGRVASLLEVGTGFHPELTGRENIYLNGAILGMSRAEIERSFDEIVEFAEVSKFLDTPVKRYSSGMYVRLAFAVAAHLDSDVLLIDEVLAVGDQNFQQKCLGKLGDVSAQGRTILFVSHNLASVSRLCKKIIVLDGGEISFFGDVNDGISVYNHQMQSESVLSDNSYTGGLYPDIKYSRCLINKEEIGEGVELDPLQAITFDIEGQSEIILKAYRTVLSIRKDGQLLFSLYDVAQANELAKGTFRASYEIPSHMLIPGEYTFSIGGVDFWTHRWLWSREYRFNIASRWEENYDTTSADAGLINIKEFGQRHVD